MEYYRILVEAHDAPQFLHDVHYMVLTQYDVYEYVDVDDVDVDVDW